MELADSRKYLFEKASFFKNEDVSDSPWSEESLRREDEVIALLPNARFKGTRDELTRRIRSGGMGSQLCARGKYLLEQHILTTSKHIQARLERKKKLTRESHPVELLHLKKIALCLDHRRIKNEASSALG